MYAIRSYYDEKLIQIGPHHGQKKDPLQEGNAFILTFVENPAIEGQPGELTVEVPLR